MFHTLGQRQGLGIGGLKNHNEEAWYVVDKLLESNQLVVGQGNQHPRLFSNSLLLSQIDWVEGSLPDLPLRCAAKTRYRQADQNCTVTYDNDTQNFRVDFDEPQRAVTPGQSCVFYTDEICLGGGVIEARLN